MQLITQDPASKHGPSYIALKNDYYLLATAQKNCFATDRPQQKDIKSEIEQARTILKSVRVGT